MAAGMTPQHEPVTVEVLHRTERAVHCLCTDGAKRWLPRSTVAPSSWTAITPGQSMEIWVASWLVQKEHLRSGKPRRIDPKSPEGRAIAQRYSR